MQRDRMVRRSLSGVLVDNQIKLWKTSGGAVDMIDRCCQQ